MEKKEDDYWEKLNEELDHLDYLWDTKIFYKRTLGPEREKEIAAHVQLQVDFLRIAFNRKSRSGEK